MARTGLIFTVLTALLLVAPASAQNRLSVAAFYGSWKGSAISESEISVHFHVTARDIGVTVEPAGEDRFKLTSATIQRKKGTPENPVEELKTNETIFEKGENGIWWAENSGDPREGDVLRWARIDKNALVISSFVVHEDGTSEVQTNRRSITDRGMELVFTRTVDGDLVRTVKGQLVRVK